MYDNTIKIAVPMRSDYSEHYLNALRMSGADPVRIDPKADWNADDYAGLVLPGGVDIEPLRYGEEVNGSLNSDPELDEFQLKIMDAFVRQRKPILGICRGLQLINIYFHGTLTQDIGSYVQFHARDKGSDEDKVHITRADPERFLADLYGTEFYTNSSHHQAIKHLGEGLCIVQRSKEGIPEAMYHVVLPIWSVQWHPERMCYAYARKDTVDGSILLKWFINKCAEHITNQ